MRFKYFPMIVTLLVASHANAQVNDADPSKFIFKYVDQMPEPTFDMKQYLKVDVLYPETARKNRIQETVLAQFVVYENGTTGGVKVLKGIGGGCDEEAVRVLEHMPKWKCGRRNGVPAKVYINQAVEFGGKAK